MAKKPKHPTLTPQELITRIFNKALADQTIAPTQVRFLLESGEFVVRYSVVK